MTHTQKIIIQEISIAYNPQLKKLGHNMFTEEYKINTYIKTKQQKRTDRAHHDYHTIDNHEEREKEKKKAQHNSQTGGKP